MRLMELTHNNSIATTSTSTMSASPYDATGSPPVSSGAGTAAASIAASANANANAVVAAPASTASTIHSNLSVKYEFNAGALSVDATGSFGVLAGRKGLHLIDLEAPYMPAATLHHQTKWEVTVVKCSPHVQFKGHVASTSNHNTLIWNIANAHGSSMIGNVQSKPPNNSSQPLVATLRAHTRPVSDIAWSRTEPWVLATCSADTKTHLWDMRTPQKPVQTLHAFTSSATQVEWNRVDATSIATAHDGDVRIWDTRASDKGPAVSITAHMQKIYGIDWHPTRLYELVTCSEDKSVKFWNVTQPRVCQGMLTTGAPVWRARYAPFGDGLVTISHRLDNSVRLWALSHSEPSGIGVDPVHTYTGHSDLVKGVVWRARPSAGAYQLVSWAKNQELRMWRVDAQHLEACGYDTTSYADVSPSEPTEMRHADVARYQQRSSKYDISALRTDFVPLVVPPSAVPLGASEYSLDGHADSMNALLVFDEDLAKIGEPESSSDDETSGAAASAGATTAAGASASGTDGNRGAGKTDAAATDSSDTSASGSARALPCPRFSGACFSGPNMLLVFDSRVAIGQTRSSAVPAAAVAAGKPVKTPAPVNKLPRTYEELLDLRDSRFATKKNKKPPVKLLSTPNVLGAMDMTGDWGQHDLLMDTGGTLFGDDMEPSMLAYHRTVTTGTGNTGSSSLFFGAGMETSAMDHEKPVHGGSEYLKTYFATSEFHLPINHPEHRISVPVSAGNISPRGGPSSRVERSKRLEQAPGAALNLDLSLSVTVLDLSKLCGVSSILTYKTELAPQKLVPKTPDNALTNVHESAVENMKQPVVLESGSRSLLAWMQQAADRRSIKGSRGRRVHPVEAANGGINSDTTKPAHHLSHVLQSLLQPPPESLTTTAVKTTMPDILVDSSSSDVTHSVSNTCAHNAHVATLAGRPDLAKVWSLLELSTAPTVDLPMYKQPLALASTHPWSAHPFGKRLVDKILGVYEQAGDLPAVASIVCALKPVETESKSDASSIHGGDHMHRKHGMSGTGDVGTNTVASTDDEFYFVGGSTLDSMRSRKSSNTLSQLVEDASDVAPTMKHARRSISHNDVGRASFGERSAAALGGAGAAHERDYASVVSGLRIAKDWPVPSTANRMLSPVRTPPPPSSRTTPRGSSITAGWRMEFESPFKTWSGAASKEASPRKALTHETFQSPVPSMPEHASLPDDDAAALLRPDGYTGGTNQGDMDDESDDHDGVHASERIALQLAYRSSEDTCLLSTTAADEARYDVYKASYADLLYRYGATDLRADVLKTVSTDEPEHEGIAFALRCHACQTVRPCPSLDLTRLLLPHLLALPPGAAHSLTLSLSTVCAVQPTDDPVCSSCRDFAVKCSVCQLVVRGQSMFCMTCGHGGHAEHLREWFEFESSCPTGCGCWCKASTSTTALAPFAIAEAPQEHVPSRSYSF